MTNSRKWKFPVLIGAAIVAAGILFYFGNAHVNSRATQGAIAHRDVYRDADVKTADVGTPGAAPVAVTAVLQSKDFQKLAKDKAFQDLLVNGTFVAAAQQASFWSVVQNSQFQALIHNSTFTNAVQNQAVISALQANSQQQMTAELRQALIFAHAENLIHESNFNSLLASGALQQAVRVNAFANLLQMAPFWAVVNNSSFQGLARDGSLQAALMQGNAANLSAAMRPLE